MSNEPAACHTFKKNLATRFGISYEDNISTFITSIAVSLLYIYQLFLTGHVFNFQVKICLCAMHLWILTLRENLREVYIPENRNFVFLKTLDFYYFNHGITRGLKAFLCLAFLLWFFLFSSTKRVQVEVKLQIRTQLTVFNTEIDVELKTIARYFCPCQCLREIEEGKAKLQRVKDEWRYA